MVTDPREAYDRWAAQYDTDANDTRDLNAEVLRKQTSIGTDDAVLELGCGTGLNAEWLAAQAGHVVATLMLEHVEALGPVFREARRVVRDGGTFYLAELHPTRQFGGTQAHFEDEATGETVVIDAFTHPVSEFVNAGVGAGFAVREMGEWRAEGDAQPRPLAIRFGARPNAADS
jgi:ubiquinone/menaquinone biosynthesis C-methylase UbiE